MKSVIVQKYTSGYGWSQEAEVYACCILAVKFEKNILIEDLDKYQTEGIINRDEKISITNLDHRKGSNKDLSIITNLATKLNMEVVLK